MALYITERCIGCSACIHVCPVGAISGERKGLHVIDGSLCIECAACGRVCPKEAVEDVWGSRIEQLRKADWLVPEFDLAACTGCENCVYACPANALVMIRSRDSWYPSLVRPASCVSCGWCVENCLFDAVSLTAKRKDKIEIINEKYGDVE
ncbi:MAG: 4Fe-4S binding protein [Spirochaetia bacterium]|nr:4Fe-4S binding protein [Spirochaetia bacterium]